MSASCLKAWPPSTMCPPAAAAAPPLPPPVVHGGWLVSLTRPMNTFAVNGWMRTWLPPRWGRTCIDLCNFIIYYYLSNLSLLLSLLLLFIIIIIVIIIIITIIEISTFILKLLFFILGLWCFSHGSFFLLLSLSLSLSLSSLSLTHIHTHTHTHTHTLFLSLLLSLSLTHTLSFQIQKRKIRFVVLQHSLFLRQHTVFVSGRRPRSRSHGSTLHRVFQHWSTKTCCTQVTSPPPLLHLPPSSCVHVIFHSVHFLSLQHVSRFLCKVFILT